MLFTCGEKQAHSEDALHVFSSLRSDAAQAQVILLLSPLRSDAAQAQVILLLSPCPATVLMPRLLPVAARAAQTLSPLAGTFLSQWCLAAAAASQTAGSAQLTTDCVYIH